MPAAVLSCSERGLEALVTAVMIGVDPHKGSHTAVAIGGAEEPLGRLRVRASADQAQRPLPDLTPPYGPPPRPGRPCTGPSLEEDPP